MPLFRTSEYYIKQILEKEVKLLTSRLKMTGGPTESCVAQIKR